MEINGFYFVKSLCFCSNETVTFVCNVTRLTIKKTLLTIRLSKVKYLHRRKLKQKYTFAYCIFLLILIGIKEEYN